MIRSSLAALLILAACATPQERCVNAATEDLRVVNALIAETRANIARGYAIVREPETRVGIRFCTGRSNNLVLCTDNETTNRERPVALDLDAERRKLRSLEEKRRELEVRTRRDIAACEAAAG